MCNKRKARVMISQPMHYKTDDEIERTKEEATKYLESKGYDVVNSYFTDRWHSDESLKERGVVNIDVCFLAKSLDKMSMCDAVYFCKGWHEARGCCIEHEVAEKYGLEIIYERG